MNNFDKLGVAGRIEEFDRRNSGNPVLCEGWFFYANGAVRELDPLGALIDPPVPEYERLTNILRYHQGRLDQAVRKFDVFKEQLMMNPYPDKAALDQLKQLQTTVGKRSAAVTAAQQQLDATEEGQRRIRSRELDAEQGQRLAVFKEDVKAIRI